MFRIAKKSLGNILRKSVLTPQQIPEASAIVDLQPLGSVIDSTGEFLGTCEGGLRFPVGVAF